MIELLQHEKYIYLHEMISGTRIDISNVHIL